MQFKVYMNLFEETQEDYPYYLNVQNNLHDRLHSRMVIPLSQKAEDLKGLSPLFEIGDKKYIAVVPEMFAVPVIFMGKEVADLSEKSSLIIDAVDLLIVGF